MLRLLLATLVAIFLPIAGCLDTDPVFTNDDDDTATDDDDTATDDDDSASDDDDSNTFADGESFTLSGSGFGAKATAAPIRYDDFESGTLGTNVEGYSYFLGGSAESAAHDYDATHVFGGSQSFFIDLPNGVYTNGSYIPDLGLEEVYFSYRVYVQDLGTGDTEDGPQVKYGRVTSGLGSDPFHGSPSINATQQGLGGEGQNIWWNNGSEDNVSFYGSSVTGGAWHRIELYMLLSDVDVRNGERYYMMDYSAGATHSTMPGGHFSDPWGEGLDPNLYEGAAIATLTSASNGSLLNNAVLPKFGLTRCTSTPPKPGWNLAISLLGMTAQTALPNPL
jgi:hypothetical protein